MKKYQVTCFAFFFFFFATSAIAQSNKEPVLYPIRKETIKVVKDDDKNWQPVKPESKPASSDQTKPEKQKVENPDKPEKEKKEKPEKFREAEHPKYNNKGR